MAGTLTTREPRQVGPWFRRGPLSSLREELDDLFSNFLSEGDGGWLAGQVLPPLDLSETESTIEVRMDVPGIKPGELDIKLTGNILTISGQRKEEYEEKGRTLYRVERRTGTFSRSVTLPCPVKEDQVNAQYRDGVLTVTIRKTEEAKARKIQVKS